MKGSHMKRLFVSPTFHAFLFCIVFLLFNWPVLSVFQEKAHAAIWIYLYSVWGIFILLLFLIAICHNDSSARVNKKNRV